ncbi:hypothetical protein GCM10020367_34040 [Streptomyces sannanensis]|uniref:Uncharacterized protein n=1 Tax=Streptomyces sannanensis TaxID=285536 RepID=A0ABP6SD45_9ACTN
MPPERQREPGTKIHSPSRVVSAPTASARPVARHGWNFTVVITETTRVLSGQLCGIRVTFRRWSHVHVGTKMFVLENAVSRLRPSPDTDAPEGGGHGDRRPPQRGR